jgi:hypothetical protein
VFVTLVTCYFFLKEPGLANIGPCQRVIKPLEQLGGIGGISCLEQLSSPSYFITQGAAGLSYVTLARTE